jgi:DNA-binding NarL/FixJ family response regulator
MISIPPIRVMIVDDHPLVRAGLASVINQQLDMMAVAETEGGDGIIELYQHHRPDVILMDLRLRGDSGARLTRVIRETYPSACVLVISNYDTDDDITQALDAGAIGYVFKSVVEDELVDAIRAVKAGRRYLPIGVAARLLDLASELTLTRGESEILNLLNQGLRNRELGQVLGESDDAIRSHLKALFGKLNVSGREDAVEEGRRRGLLSAKSGEPS